MLILTDSFDIGYLNWVGLDEEEMKEHFVQTKIIVTPITMEQLMDAINKEYRESDVVAYCKSPVSQGFIRLLDEKMNCDIEIYTDEAKCNSVAGGDEGDHYILFYYSQIEGRFYTISDIKVERYDKNGLLIK